MARAVRAELGIRWIQERVHREPRSIAGPGVKCIDALAAAVDDAQHGVRPKGEADRQPRRAVRRREALELARDTVVSANYMNAAETDEQIFTGSEHNRERRQQRRVPYERTETRASHPLKRSTSMVPLELASRSPDALNAMPIANSSPSAPASTKTHRNAPETPSKSQTSLEARFAATMSPSRARHPPVSG